MTARGASAPAAPVFDKQRVTKLPLLLDVSQPVFARLLNVSAAPVRSSEQRSRVPDGTSLELRALNVGQTYSASESFDGSDVSALQPAILIVR